MVPAYLLALKPLGFLVFNAPGDTTAATHGPAVGGRGAEQPLPSTIAGMLAAEARRKGLCNPEDCAIDCINVPGVARDFHNIHECLAELLGQRYQLYTGLAVPSRDSSILVYTERGYMKPSSLDKLLGEGEAEALRPLRKAYTGIALNPVTKTVRQSMLYTVEQLLPKDFHYAALIVSDKALRLPRVARFGAEAGVTHPQLARLDGEPWRLLLGKWGNDCRTWLLNLASPALIEEAPWGRGEPVVLSREKAMDLFYKLLGQELRVKAVRVPKSSPGLEVVAPGWCTPRNSPRYPMLYVPAGTIFIVEADAATVENIVRRGLGANTRQGWGTVAATCIK